jgi:hypothetical protein
MNDPGQDRFDWFQTVVESLSAATIDIAPAFSVEDIENKKLTKLLRVPLRHPLPTKSHNPIRTIVRIRCEEFDCHLEKIEFSRKEMIVKVVMERRVSKIWKKLPWSPTS